MPELSTTNPHSAYASLMLPMDINPATESRAKLAVDLADRFSCRLIGIGAHPVTAPMYFETPVDGVASILEIEERRANENIQRAEAAFRRAAGNRNEVQWRHSLTFPLDYICEQARAADLIIAARPHRDEQAFGPMTFDGGDLVMAIGRPVLFVPSHIDYLSAKRVIIGWKDTRECRRAVWDALPFLKAAEEVMVAAIGTDNKAGKDVAGYLGSHGVQALALSETKPAGSVGDELIRLAEQEGADLIVCGAYGHSRSREWILGGVTRDLLDHSPLCCFMSH